MIRFVLSTLSKPHLSGFLTSAASTSMRRSTVKSSLATPGAMNGFSNPRRGACSTTTLLVPPSTAFRRSTGVLVSNRGYCNGGADSDSSNSYDANSSSSIDSYTDSHSNETINLGDILPYNTISSFKYDDITPHFYSTLEPILGLQQYAPATTTPGKTTYTIKGITHGEYNRKILPMRVDGIWVFFIIDEDINNSYISPETYSNLGGKKTIHIEGMKHDVIVGWVDVLGRDFMKKHGGVLVSFGGGKVKMVFGGRNGEYSMKDPDEDNMEGEGEEEEEGEDTTMDTTMDTNARRIVLQKVKRKELTPMITIGGDKKEMENTEKEKEKEKKKGKKEKKEKGNKNGEK